MAERLVVKLPGEATEYVVLEVETLIDFGQGRGPKAGVITIKDGAVRITGSGAATLAAEIQDAGGTLPATLSLNSGRQRAVVLQAHPNPATDHSRAPLRLQGKPALMQMTDDEGRVHVKIDGDSGSLWLGGKGTDGDALLFAAGEDPVSTQAATIHLAGGAANTGGSAVFRSATGQERVVLEAQGARMWIGGNGAGGDICVFASGETQTRDHAKATVHINGEAGDIVLRNADCAEEFDTSMPLAAPGTVMVIADDESLAPSQQAYDRRVAGVVSGAGRYRPAIVLDRRSEPGERLPIALVGKVHCKVDADAGAIEIGDLLTTSATPGHAMKVGDHGRALGSIIGKALQPIASGKGMIPILVALQ